MLKGLAVGSSERAHDRELFPGPGGVCLESFGWQTQVQHEVSTLSLCV